MTSKVLTLTSASAILIWVSKDIQIHQILFSFLPFYVQNKSLKAVRWQPSSHRSPQWLQNHSLAFPIFCKHLVISSQQKTKGVSLNRCSVMTKASILTTPGKKEMSFLETGTVSIISVNWSNWRATKEHYSSNHKSIIHKEQSKVILRTELFSPNLL